VPGAPVAGWYDDPERPGRLRWWDGERWSEHTRELPDRAPAPQPEPATPEPEEPAAAEPSPASSPQADLDPAALLAGIRAEPEPDPLRRAMPWLIGGIVLLIALFATVLFIGPDAETGNGTPDEQTTADTTSQAQVRTAQAAIETYAADHNASYVGATPASLVQIEPSLQGADLAVEADAGSYTVSVSNDVSGNTFAITQDTAGLVTYDCSDAGVAGCPAGGQWG
jgi:hypothetical protein